MATIARRIPVSAHFSVSSGDDSMSSDSSSSSIVILGTHTPAYKLKADKLRMEIVMTWVKVNRLLNDTNNIVLNECMKDIIELFGGNKNLLFFITKNSDKKQLQSMHQIITNQKLKYENQKKTKSIFKIKKPETNKSNINISFCRLPDECISHMCGFLNKKNIKNFKETCRHNAIISMQEMNKTSIGIFNLNNLPTHFNDLCHLNKKMVKYSRHSSKKRFYSLFEDWSKQFNIPENRQLIFKSNFQNRTFELIDSQTKRLQPIKKNIYLICDQRKFVILDENKITKFNPTKHSYKMLKDYALMILEYFDISKQTTNIIQFVLYKKNKVSFKTVLDYIEYKFILLNTEKWYYELKHILKQMCYDKNQPKLTMFVHKKYGKMFNIYNKNIIGLDVYPNRYCFTFQINYNHPWFNKTNKFEQTKLECTKQMHKFHVSAKEFCENIRSISVTYKGNKLLIKSAIENYFDSNFNENEKYVFENDVNTILKCIDNTPKIKANTTSNSLILRKKISKLFGNIIDPKYIELYVGYVCKRKKWNDLIDERYFHFQFVLYDIQSMDYNKMGYKSLYNIRIYDPMNVPYPFRFKTKGKTVSIVYKQKFMVKDFVEYIFKTIYGSKNRILSNEYRDIIAMFYDNINTNKTCIKNDKIKCILAHNKRGWIRDGVVPFTQFSLNEIYTNKSPNRIKQFDLYMIRHKCDEIRTQFKLNIKFISNENEKLNTKSDINNINNLKYVGLPMTIFINKNDTIQYIIDKYLSETKQFIQFCYRVKIKDKIISIPERLRSKYKPYYEFIKTNKNDFIIFKFKKEKPIRNDKCLPIYGIYDDSNKILSDTDSDSSSSDSDTDSDSSSSDSDSSSDDSDSDSSSL